MEMSDCVYLKYSVLQDFARALNASGTRIASVELNSTVTSISDGVRQMLCIPWRGEERRPLGHTLDLQLHMCARYRSSLGRFDNARGLICRPTSIRHTCSDAQREIPATVIRRDVKADDPHRRRSGDAQIKWAVRHPCVWRLEEQISFMGTRVHVLAEASNRLPRFLRRRLRRRAFRDQGVLCHGFLRRPCVALVVTIARGEHGVCVSTHTCVLQKQGFRGDASACGDTV